MYGISNIMLERKICPCCRIKPVAIANKRNGKTYYRTKCDQCYRFKKKPLPPEWIKSGYKKKEKCEKCGFRFKFPEQSHVFHLDGNTENNDWFNLKTVCANCQIEVQHSKLPWRHSKLKPD